MQIGPFEAAVLVNGRPVREYPHNDGNTYVEGRRGSEFQLRFRNLTSRRVMLVPSVDGLSVMDGKPASEQSTGYVVRGYGSLEIPGWRLDDHNVARFIFKDRRRSYAEESGEGGQNVGVIGFMVFEEKPKPVVIHQPYPVPAPWYPRPPAPWERPWWNWYPYYPGPVYPYGSNTAAGVSGTVGEVKTSGGTIRHVAARGIAPTASVASHSSNSAGHSETVMAANVAEGDFSIGTGFGDQAQHQVRRVDFEKRTSLPDQTLVLYYDSRKNLERRGIVVQGERWDPGSMRPNPFPALSGGCVPPAGWNQPQDDDC